MKNFKSLLSLLFTVFLLNQSTFASQPQAMKRSAQSGAGPDGSASPAKKLAVASPDKAQTDQAQLKTATAKSAAETTAGTSSASSSTTTQALSPKPVSLNIVGALSAAVTASASASSTAAATQSAQHTKEQAAKVESNAPQGSQIRCDVPLAIALCHATTFAQNYLKANNLTIDFIWKAVGDSKEKQEAHQQRLDSTLALSARALELLSSEELKALASDKADELNKFMHDNKFPIITFTQNEDKRSFGVVALLCVKSNWTDAQKNRLTKITNKSNAEFDGFVSSEFITFDVRGSQYPLIGKNFVRKYIVNHYKHMIAIEDTVWIHQVDRPISENELKSYIDNLKEDKKTGNDKGLLNLPMIDVEDITHPEFLIGAEVGNPHFSGFYLDKVTQKTRLAINHHGVCLQSGAACQVVPRNLHREVTVNGPFLIWIQRSRTHLSTGEYIGDPLILAYTYVTEKDFKEPKI
jgi:hypothetical protein